MSMEFQDQSAIYQQIANFGIDQVLERSWQVGERIPSVRQLAAEVGVNPNTVMHAYRYLEDKGIIYNQRGRGFFVGESGLDEATALRRQDFIERTLPKLVSDLELLAISPTELVDIINNYQKNTA